LNILLFLVCFTGILAPLSSEYDWLFSPKVRAVDKGQKALRVIATSVDGGGVPTVSSLEQEPKISKSLFKNLMLKFTKK
jgi:uncharacterized iron-regulated membrane protein